MSIFKRQVSCEKGSVTDLINSQFARIGDDVAVLMTGGTPIPHSQEWFVRNYPLHVSRSFLVVKGVYVIIDGETLLTCRDPVNDKTFMLSKDQILQVIKRNRGVVEAPVESTIGDYVIVLGADRSSIGSGPIIGIDCVADESFRSVSVDYLVQSTPQYNRFVHTRIQTIPTAPSRVPSAAVEKMEMHRYSKFVGNDLSSDLNKFFIKKGW